jgi:hypothetical protein
MAPRSHMVRVMGKGLASLGLLALVCTLGCRGVAGDLPTDLITYKFDGKVLVNPAQPVTNKRVSINLELTSASARSVQTDIVLKVVSKEATMYESTWDKVLFHENEVWNLTQGFLPDSDANKKPWQVQIQIRDHDSGQVLYDQALARLDFNI